MTLTRNTTSPVPPVSEVSMEIFGQIFTELRFYLKNEIGVFFTEIILPILEGRQNTIPWHQRYMMFKSLCSFFHGNQGAGRIFVELFANYDCDVEASAKENIWERLISTVSKILSHHQPDSSNPQNSASFQPINCFTNPAINNETPALTTTNLVALTREQVKELTIPNGDLVELKRVGTDFLVRGVLEPLVALCDSKNFGAESSKLGLTKTENDSEIEKPQMKENTSNSKVNADSVNFGNMKLKKQAIIEGVKKFNIKPKKVFFINFYLGYSVIVGFEMY